MSELFVLENQSETDYFLDYTLENKRNFIYLFGGNRRKVLSNKKEEISFRISNLNGGVKDFSFFGKFPGKIVIQKSEKEDFDYICDQNTSKRINLNNTNTKYALSKRTSMDENNYKILSLSSFGTKKSVLDKNGIKSFFDIL